MIALFFSGRPFLIFLQLTSKNPNFYPDFSIARRRKAAGKIDIGPQSGERNGSARKFKGPRNLAPAQPPGSFDLNSLCSLAHCLFDQFVQNSPVLAAAAFQDSYHSIR